MKRLSFLFLALVALCATLGGYASSPPARSSPRLSSAWTPLRSAARQLPTEFVVPPADRDLKLSSLVTADLDADGDLDVVATDASSGSVRLVVWENDGSGRLQRKQPARPKSLGTEPADPSLAPGQERVVVSIQPDAPAVEPLRENRFTLPARRSLLSVSVFAASATLATLRSRSPPALS